MGGKIFRSGLSIQCFAICKNPIGPLRGGARFWENWAYAKVARSSKKIPYGVYRSGNRALTSVQGPLNHTLIIPQVEAFVK